MFFLAKALTLFLFSAFVLAQSCTPSGDTGCLNGVGYNTTTEFVCRSVSFLIFYNANILIFQQMLFTKSKQVAAALLVSHLTLLLNFVVMMAFTISRSTVIVRFIITMDLQLKKKKRIQSTPYNTNLASTINHVHQQVQTMVA